MIALIDYGMGNIHSLRSMLEHLQQDVLVTRDRSDLIAADKVVLPGVGSYRQAMRNLTDYGLVDCIKELVENDIPLLGICLGMQVLGLRGAEDGETLGLGLVEGEVDYFGIVEDAEEQKIPHVGFNDISIVRESLLLHGLPEKPDFYFTHSYRMQCSTPDVVTGTASNGESFVACVEKGRVFGTQFHPELSQKNGLLLLKNFISI